jgi:hypothetical protein
MVDDAGRFSNIRFRFNAWQLGTGSRSETSEAGMMEKTGIRPQRALPIRK